MQIASESVTLRLGEPSCSITYNDSICPPDPGHPGSGGLGGGGGVNFVLCVDHIQGSRKLRDDSVWCSYFGRAMLRHLLHVMWLSVYALDK